MGICMDYMGSNCKGQAQNNRKICMVFWWVKTFKLKVCDACGLHQPSESHDVGKMPIMGIP